MLWISEPRSSRDAVSHEMVCWQKKVVRASAFAGVVSIVFVADAVTTVRSGMTVFLFSLQFFMHFQKSLDVSGDGES